MIASSTSRLAGTFSFPLYEDPPVIELLLDPLDSLTPQGFKDCIVGWLLSDITLMRGFKGDILDNQMILMIF